MWKINLLLVISLAFATAAPKSPRIIGGSFTNIEDYPSFVSLMLGAELMWFHVCGGAIINTRNILTAAHCTEDPHVPWRARVGTSLLHTGGAVHRIINILNHPEFDIAAYLDCDISIVRTDTPIVYNDRVRPGFFAGPNYLPADDSEVWAVGFGATGEPFPTPRLRHVQMWTINSAVCRVRYGNDAFVTINNNMICAGWLDVGGRDQCVGDSGGPMYHDNVIVGVSSWGGDCASAWYPGVNARVSTFAPWIQANAVV